MLTLNLVVLAVVAAATWWLTGLDKNHAGESKRGHYFTRSLRTIAVVFLVAVMLALMAGGGAGGVPLLLIAPVGIALLLRSSVAEIFTQGILRLIDPGAHDHRPVDPHAAQRHRDAIAYLIHHGQTDAAIKLCEELKLSGELDAATLENTLEFLGVKPERTAVERPVNQAARLRMAGKLTEAEALLKKLLTQNPADAGAAMLLLRLYAEDLRQPDRAWELWHKLKQQARIPATHLEFARRSISEWSAPAKVKVATTAAASSESVNDLLAQGFLGSAIELLEAHIREQPTDLDLRLKLAEIHARRCSNLPRAEKLIRALASEKIFSLEQLEIAQAQLKEWRETLAQRK
jgi:tetratricopeptide (TPR) repeat protein